ncbi:MAG: hypothetical protein QM630_01065 [Microbacterium sp.]
MRIRLDNDHGYTAERVHGVLMRAMTRRERALAVLGEMFLNGDRVEDYPAYQREAVEDAQVIEWALSQVWEGMAGEAPRD